LKDRRLAEYAKKKLVAQRKAYFAKVAKYDWPQMTIKGDEICVPELSSKDATDWKEHLTCYTTTPTGEADDFEFDIPGDPVEKEGS
jgi:hypothetical protein